MGERARRRGEVDLRGRRGGRGGKRSHSGLWHGCQPRPASLSSRERNAAAGRRTPTRACCARAPA
eukprot:148142-Chlamydomonas_euryale.AAC.3